MRVVEFVDSSILLELIDVPGKATKHDAIVDQLNWRVEQRRALILPTAAVIETGNHIHHVADGAARRRCATTFSTMLALSARGEAPWVLHDATWDEALLDAVRSGCSTGMDLVEHATRGRDVGLGTGDLSILAERDAYRARRVDRQSIEVRVWSADGLLAAFAEL